MAKKFRMIGQLIYWWPVIVALPDPHKPGEVEEFEFEVKFEGMPEDELKKLDADFAAMEPEKQMEEQHYLLKRVVLDWRGMEDDVAFSPESFDAALNWKQFRAGLYNAYAESLSGGGARRKN